MTSLRARLAVLLVVAIVSVVGLATFAASRALRSPLPEATMEPLASQIAMLTKLAANDRRAALDAGMSIRTAPSTGIAEQRMSQALSHAMQRIGEARTVVVTRAPDTPILTASVSLGSGDWLVFDIPDMRPPPGGWEVMIGWICLIVIGATGVSLFAASKIMRPLEMLQDAAGRIGSDGVLPHIAETGSGEVRATARALNLLSARLKAAMESRMRLVAAAGHDLRTPMTRMRLRAEFIAEDEEREKWLADLEELDTIADSAIRLVREEVNSDSVERLRLDKLVRDISGELTDLGYRVGLGELPVVSVAAGPVALKRALRNLLVNAATHGAGAQVDLSANSGSAVLTIVDKGPGIPEELLSRVFEPFFRVDMARRKMLPGAGLGLAIAKEIIERQGGTLTIENGHPTGLVQTVVLPAARPQAVAPDIRPTADDV